MGLTNLPEYISAIVAIIALLISCTKIASKMLV